MVLCNGPRPTITIIILVALILLILFWPSKTTDDRDAGSHGKPIVVPNVSSRANVSVSAPSRSLSESPRSHPCGDHRDGSGTENGSSTSAGLATAAAATEKTRLKRVFSCLVALFDNDRCVIELPVYEISQTEAERCRKENNATEGKYPAMFTHPPIIPNRD